MVLKSVERNTCVAQIRSVLSDFTIETLQIPPVPLSNILLLILAPGMRHACFKELLFVSLPKHV